MALGAGKYHNEFQAACQACGATNAILIVFDGKAGVGFEAALSADKLQAIPEILRDVARRIEEDMRHRSLVAAVGTPPQNQ